MQYIAGFLVYGRGSISKNISTIFSDRYISFDGIDCDGNARLIIGYIECLITQPGSSNVFREYFMNKRAGGSGPKPDDLFLIHSNINQVRELFEIWDDEEAMSLLIKLEEECC